MLEMLIDTFQSCFDVVLVLVLYERWGFSWTMMLNNYFSGIGQMTFLTALTSNKKQEGY